MTTAMTRNVAQIDFELDMLRIKARAEAALDEIQYQDNPFIGATEQLAALEGERDHLARVEFARTLVAAFERRNELRATIDRIQTEREDCEIELNELERHPVIARFKNGPALANTLESRGNFEAYSRHLTSTRPRPLTDLEVPLRTWPAALRFDDADRAIIQRHAALVGTAGVLIAQQEHARSVLAELERNRPEVRYV